jgi:hypothetical protein
LLTKIKTMDCEQAYNEGAKKIAEYYKPMIDENQKIISNMEAKNLPTVSPRTFYDINTGDVIDLIALRDDLLAKLAEQIADMKNKVDGECGKIVDILQFALDNAIAYYTDGISLILPKHMTHIDMAEILKGNIAGGENSFVNESKNFVFNSLGIPENNDLRKIINNPLDPIKDLLGNLGIHL